MTSLTLADATVLQVWDFETVDNADTTDESPIFEMEPMNELRVGHHSGDVSLRSMVKGDQEETFWFAQVC